MMNIFEEGELEEKVDISILETTTEHGAIEVIFDGQDAYFQDSNIVWIENDETQVLNKYLFHFYKIAKWYVAEGSTIQRLYIENLKKTLMPLPPLLVQEEIVRILDNLVFL